ncbi:DapH/DapD/GlmU-related protein [Loigolactobacillus backii]|uniref:Acetyltransferase n=1 Tax=Loigolactobacillus backii TaxID=375175 RepID=A0A192H2I5_9LACO|nr:DapH/DapD/GlmU-related protein [Loigolactobacillus backii]ANK63024.1 acetyltransferase [Loigolactobacillus backii]ANK69968.1 acetyltransferase [Loigolactobacillus backii]MDA5388552.1 sugar O-acetyltransferase [Loigolactobacillus backii]MDA5391006.1 sugar O-acetyltransferase [Loigolactobacillus backii]
MSVFADLQNGQTYDIRDADYQSEVHGEIDRCDHICFEINNTDPVNKTRLVGLENELLANQMQNGTYFTPPMHIDCANSVHLGENVYANHSLTMMSLGGITIDNGVMLGPGVGLFTVNHEPKNIRVVKTGAIHIKKNAWLGARVSVLPGVTIGENAIIGTGAVVTKDIPANSIAVGTPAKVIKKID